MPWNTRRQFIKSTSCALASAYLSPIAVRATEFAPQTPDVEVVNPRARVPLSFVIDDSTCLVNMGHFCMPQFAEAWPNRPIYKKPWKTWPREIPDAFVREFGEWCAEHGVKGKYSIVPYPACVGWLDRELPGWSRSELQASINLVRELMLPNWDIHPEMITHTRVIDLSTGRPLQEISAATMENSYPQTKLSVDQLAAYLAYALRILKNCGLPCEGITTPGGFGSKVKTELSLAVFEAVRDVFASELPHYFKYVISNDESTQPKLEHVRDLDSDDPRVTVNVPAGTGDWFGGWEGDRKSEGFRYTNHDATAGRMVELIQRGEPAVMLCHWPGMYCNGAKHGFNDFKNVVTALAGRFGDETIWMKLSEIGRYWAARELTRINRQGQSLELTAPFQAADFTMRIGKARPSAVTWSVGRETVRLQPVSALPKLTSGHFFHDGRDLFVCVELPKGRSRLEGLAS